MTENRDLGAAFYDHLTQYLGSPVDRQVFQSNEAEPPIQVLQFDKVFPKCKVFCSFGTSHYTHILGGAAEVILPCDDGWDAAGGLLANALFFLVRERMQLGRGVAVKFAGVDPEFSKQFGKTAIYFTDPFGLPPGFNFVKLGSKSGRVYLSFFI